MSSRMETCFGHLRMVAAVVVPLWICLLLSFGANGEITCRSCNTPILLSDEGLVRDVGQRRVVRELMRNSHEEQDDDHHDGREVREENPRLVQLHLLNGYQPGTRGRRDHKVPKEGKKKNMIRVKRDQTGGGRNIKEDPLTSFNMNPKRVNRDQTGGGGFGIEEDLLTSLNMDPQMVKGDQTGGRRVGIEEDLFTSFNMNPKRVNGDQTGGGGFDIEEDLLTSYNMDPQMVKRDQTGGGRVGINEDSLASLYLDTQRVKKDQTGGDETGILLPSDPNEGDSLTRFNMDNQRVEKDRSESGRLGIEEDPFTSFQKDTQRVKRDQSGGSRLGIMLPSDPSEEDPLTSFHIETQKVKRAEAKGSREEGRLNRARMEELRLSSTSFPLTGDSAHNQAMVHWTGGHNSSVILILTKLYDFNLGSVTESSLWRSTDYGTTYEKFNEKVGLKTVLSYLYVSPTNKKKIMLLSDPDVESSIWISSDAGATYQKFRINFFIQSLLFHPKQEDWVLAYSLDQKLYSSMDFGRRWHLMHERITPNRFYWSVMGLDKEADLVHMEARTADGHAHYIACRIQECSETTRSGPFSRYIDTNSLVVQDDYVFIQATSGGRASYYVSYRREAFAQIKLPKYSLPKDMHIISTAEKQVFAAVQEWNQNDTYNLYISDIRGVFFTLALENVKSSRGLEGNIVIDLYEVAGIKGLFLANKKVDERVKTFITYNKGRDWRLIQAPDTDMKGNPINCLLPFCSLHFNLQMSENPYNSGSISSKVTAPWLIVGSGNIGPELSSTDTNMYISSDGGNSWKHIFEEEYNIWFLDWGGALVAMKHTSLPVRHLWLSFDEGRLWSKYAFTSLPLFVDGALVEPGVENQIMTVFGHFSLLSEWQLVKVDYKSLFGRKCGENDFENWHLHNQRDFCVMGERKTFRKRRPGSKCMVGKDYLRIITEPCLCSHWDFECDYGYERQGKNQCTPAFWFNPTSISKDCSQGQSYLRSSGYRRIVSNNCTDGLREQYRAKPQQCQRKAPQGLQLSTSDGKVGVQQGQNVTFLVHLEEGDLQRINIQLDFGDGSAVSYANFSKIEDGIKHVYKNAGIYQVVAYAENSVGIDSAVLYLHVTSPVEHVHLRVPFVAIRNKEANVSAVVWPSHPGTLTYFWWVGNNTKPVITLDNSISLTFSVEGSHTITVQVSAGNTLIQDTKEVAVHEYFQSQLLSFSPNLDFHNPDIPEWRQDISRLIKSALIQVTHIPEELILVAMFPGLPTSAELFILPPKNISERRKGSKADLEQIVESLFSALNQNLVMFELKPGVQIFVYVTQLTLAPLVDNSASHSSSAMLMLLSVVFVGLAVFLIYKFKRKIPWINIYAQVQHDKEQEMIGSVSQTDNAPKISLSNFTEEELTDKELDTRVIGSISTIANSESTKEIPNCTSV